MLVLVCLGSVFFDDLMTIHGHKSVYLQIQRIYAHKMQDDTKELHRNQT